MDNTSSLEELSAALAAGDSFGDNERFLAAIEQIKRRGPAAAALVPDLAMLTGDLRTVAVPNDRAAAETDSDHDFIPRGQLALGALAAIGAAAVDYLAQRYRSGDDRARWAAAIAAMGAPGLAATLTILRETEWVRGRVIANLTLHGLPNLPQARYDRLRELTRDAWRRTNEGEQLILELDRLIAEA